MGAVWRVVAVAVAVAVAVVVDADASWTGGRLGLRRSALTRDDAAGASVGVRLPMNL